MKNNHYTIIISPSDLRPAKKLTVHRSTVILSVITILILTVCGIFGSYKFAEHADLQAQIMEAKRDIAELREANLILMRSREKEQKIREFLGIDGSIHAPGEAGQGGPGAAGEAGLDFFYSDREPLTEHIRWAKKRRTPSVVNEALALEEDYQELLDYLQERDNDLAVIPTISPVVVADAWISSPYGYRRSPFTGAKEFHSGIDISAPRGTPILATGDGKVTFAGRKGALGNAVIIVHNEELETVYGHLLEVTVKKRQGVKRGEVIGYMGNTGRSTGYHIHYEVRKGGKTVNPYHYLLNWKDRHLLAQEIAQDDAG